MKCSLFFCRNQTRMEIGDGFLLKNVGSDKLMKASHAWASLTSWYNELDRVRTKENPRTPSSYMERMKRLVHGQLIPEIMRLIYCVLLVFDHE